MSVRHARRYSSIREWRGKGAASAHKPRHRLRLRDIIMAEVDRTNPLPESSEPGRVAYKFDLTTKHCGPVKDRAVIDYVFYPRDAGEVLEFREVMLAARDGIEASGRDVVLSVVEGPPSKAVVA